MTPPRKPRFYHPGFLEIGQIITLEPDAANHVIKVLRMKTGDALILFNNQGGEYTGTLKQTKNKVEVELLEYHERSCESPLQLHLGQSLARGDRMDFIIQKATELGVQHITPLMTSRSKIKLEGKQLNKKMQHWSNIIISAAQQCGRTQLPALNIPITLEQFLNTPFIGANIGFDLSATSSLKSIRPAPYAIRLLIGPESGFDEQEIALANQSQFKFYTLGPRVLRTETASLAAISALQFFYGDLSLASL